MTYDDFVSAAQEAGLYEEFSPSDLNMARQNPQSGMTLLWYKQRWHEATTDDERKEWKQLADELRVKGAQQTPSSFNPAPAPIYADHYSGDQTRLYNEYIDFGDFTYDPADDDLYANYKKQYTREGQRSIADTLGQVSAATGGLPSSYAVTAASQAGNYYNAQLTDKIAELYQLAYNKYLNDFSMLGSKLGAANEMEQNAYQKYLNELAQSNYMNEFNYGQFYDNLNYGVTQEQLAWNQAIMAAQYTGDYSLLEALGVDTSKLEADYTSSSGGTGGYNPPTTPEPNERPNPEKGTNEPTDYSYLDSYDTYDEYVNAYVTYVIQTYVNKNATNIPTFTDAAQATKYLLSMGVNNVMANDILTMREWQSKKARYAY